MLVEKNQYTEEQREVIEKSTELDNNSILRVNACAGSGKTSTCVGIAQKNHDKKILYLVFNKNMQLEAAKKFPKNTDIRTIHSLAYLYVCSNDKKYTLRFRDYNYKEYEDIMKREKLKYRNAYFISVAMKDFLNSSYPDMTTFLKNVKKYPEKSILIKLYELFYEGKYSITHSMYLKFFHKYLSLNPNLLNTKYDMIILDESQDTNPVTWEIISNSSLPLIIVGDVFQNIYSFRDTINIMDRNSLYVKNKNKNVIDLELSYNFRSTQEILDKANNIIYMCNLRRDCLDVGLEMKDERYNPMKSKAKDDYKIETTAVLTRTNSGLIEILKSFKDNNDPRNIALSRDLDTIFEYILVLNEWLSKSKTEHKDYLFLNQFKNKEDLEKRYIYDDKKNVLDIEAKKSLDIIYDIGMVEILKVYEYTKYKLKNFNSEKRTVHIMTAHTSKGLEFDEVYLHSDFPNLAGIKNFVVRTIQKNRNVPNILDTSDIAYLKQERNLAYVAYTRAKKVLKLSESIEDDERYDIEDESKNSVSDLKEKLKKEAPNIKITKKIKKWLILD